MKERALPREVSPTRARFHHNNFRILPGSRFTE